MEFSEQIKAQLDGEIVRMTRMVEMNFKSGAQRYHQGHNRFKAKNAKGNTVTWEPTMGLGTVTGLEQASNGAAPEMRIEMSGVDPAIVAMASGASSEFYGRLVTVYWQFWAVPKNGLADDWIALGDPVVIMWGLMRSIVSGRKSTEKGVMSILTLTAETPFEGRARARNSYLTDLDQKARYPSDQMLERVAGLETREIKWPVFDAE